MYNESLFKKSHSEFKRLTGARKHTFKLMLVILQAQYLLEHKLGGKPNRISIENRLLMALEYWREYRTYFHIANSYGCSESRAYKIIKWVEDTLMNSKKFTIPGKKHLHTLDKEATILIDVTESPIERPQKKQRKYYSGKKKRHTLKTQVIVNRFNAQIVCIYTGNGKMHDYRLFKESKTKINPAAVVVVDSGYQGLQKIHANTELPKKRTKKNPLTRADKIKNRIISSKRVLNENVIGIVKRFRVLAEKYRNRRKRFHLRFNLIAGIYNFELQSEG
jgi:hypothetical protein